MIAALHWLKKREPIKDSQSNSKGYHFNVLGDIEVLTPRKQNFPFGIDLAVDILSDGIQIGLLNSPSNPNDPFSGAVIIGMFHTIAPVNENTPFVIPYKAISEVYAFLSTGKDHNNSQTITALYNEKLSKNSNFKIWIKYENEMKGTQLALGFRVYDKKKETDVNATVTLFNHILTHRNAST